MFSGGLEMATTKISELKDISIKICQAEKEREKVLKKKKTEYPNNRGHIFVIRIL